MSIFASHSRPQWVSGAAGRSGFGLASLMGALAREWRARRAEHLLEGMDDHFLQDVGLSRASIGHAVRHGRPGRRLT